MRENSFGTAYCGKIGRDVTETATLAESADCRAKISPLVEKTSATIF
jgi:hypothetical protein